MPDQTPNSLLAHGAEQLSLVTVDAYNAELTQKYATWSDEDLFWHYENVRRELIHLTAELPDDAFLNADIEGWLKDDVVGHYDEHPMPA